MESAMPEVNVVDALMGSCKTEWAVDVMKESIRNTENFYDDGQHRFLYLTPYLDEVQRIKDALPRGSVYAPKKRANSKINDLNMLLREGRNIVATHKLFEFVNEETYDALDNYQYTLIIDEVCDWVQKYPINSGDVKRLYKTGELKLDPGTRRLDWVDLPLEPGEKVSFY